MAQSTIQLTYDVPAGCPPRPVFVAAVSSRGGSFESVEPGVRARSVDVAVRAAADGFAGSLRVVQAEGVSEVRSVDAARCEDVVNGLAVVAAIALGEDAQRATDVADTSPAPPPSPSHTIEAPTPTPAPLAPPAPPAPPSPKPARLRGTSFNVPESIPVPAGTLRFDTAQNFTLSAGATLGLIPEMVLPRYDLTLGAARFLTTPAASTYLIGMMQVRWTWLGNATHRSDDGYSTQVNGFLAGVNACSALTYDSAGLVALACAQFGMGLMHLETKDPTGKETANRNVGMGTAGLGFDLQYNFSHLFHVGVKAGGEFALNFAAYRPDGSQLFESSLFSGYATAGLGIHF